MTTILDKRIKHTSIPFVGGRDDDNFTLQFPVGEVFANARIDILGGRYNAGARIEQAPGPGTSGGGHTLKVHWWFDGGSDPFNPGYIDYRIRAFTKDPKERAMIVAIENTGHIPFDIGLSGDALRLVERIVDPLVEFGEEQNAHQLFDEYYGNRLILLVNQNCTIAKIRATLAEMAANYTTDLTFIGHGGLGPGSNDDCILILHEGMESWSSNPKNLNENEARSWRERPEFANAKLGLVYMMNCHSSKFNDAWLHLGFQASIGSYKINSMPEPMFTFFWTRFRNGEPADQAAKKSWKDAKAFWQVLYPPDCRLERLPHPPFVQMKCRDNPLITDSRPIVSGNTGLRISDSLG